MAIRSHLDQLVKVNIVQIIDKPIKSSAHDFLYYEVSTNPSIIVIHRLLIYCCQTSLMAVDRVTPSALSTGAFNSTPVVFSGML